MIFPQMTALEDLSLLFLRIIVGIIFITSGWSHFTKPGKRSQSIEMSREFTFLLGMGEFIAGIFIVAGIWIQLASLLIILVLMGAISFKIFKWNIGFYSEKTTGWHYDLLILLAAFVILATGGGNYILL
jgi:putative oxidoreductase